jgi:hypothetical protein
MKNVLSFALMAAFLFAGTTTQAQEKKKPASPPMSVTETLKSGAVVSINYSSPSVKGRTIGKDLEPKAGEVWRAGANEATVFETSKDLSIEGQNLPAGKYGLFILSGEDKWTVIFNKTWKQWGAMGYKEADDALRIMVKADKAKTFAESLMYTIDKNGKIGLVWGDHQISFKAK